jgi:hypothetical protein
MNDILQPWQLLIAILSGSVHRRQQEIISLMQIQGKQRILPTDDALQYFYLT